MLEVVGRVFRVRAYPAPMTRRFLAIVAAVALSLAWMPATAAAGEPGPGDWPQFHGNPSHTGYNPS